ncbi:MAG: hypothetical protein A2X49_16885 [Lentisphaerae bacterium GWF2_52_8]|nr:MAG: hypothetical protein A2X49_16885 [Lentisphaerae bacterium GWF2_52_8]
MRPGDMVRLSLHNLLLHKVRSALTSLGIIFGVGSVIAMLAISEGAKRQALAQIQAMGIDKVFVYTKEPPDEGKDESKTSNSSIVKAFGITEDDCKHLSILDNVEYVSTVRNARRKVLKGTMRLDIKVVAVSNSFLEDAGCHVIAGRWLGVADDVNASSVCVVGRNVKRKMFNLGENKIVGSKIRIQGERFEIVGIVENNLGTQLPELDSPNDMIFISKGTSKALYGENAFEGSGRRLVITHVNYDLLILKIRDLAYIDDTAKRIVAYMGKAHAKLKDWGLVVPLDLLKQREQTQNIFTIIMGSIAGISLLVGGIGIMNIMLANVYERRKEIGTRRALGAKKTDILFQFLLETVFLTTMGGVIGVSLGLGLSKAVTYYASWPIVISAWSVMLSLLIAGLVGIVFGTYPAWKAANQNPIEVLRSE